MQAFWNTPTAVETIVARENIRMLFWKPWLSKPAASKPEILGFLATPNSDKDNTTGDESNWPLQLHHTLTFQWLWQICTADPQGEMEGRKAWHIISLPGVRGNRISFLFSSKKWCSMQAWITFWLSIFTLWQMGRVMATWVMVLFLGEEREKYNTKGNCGG